VAIVQISRITNRKGLTENLPQLAGAELGWCIDSRRLFIGNGTLQEGAPIIGNTEILTEYSDITVLSSYTYQDIVVGYAAQTGPTPSDPVVRSVQAKLDDFASIRDFGAVGDGVADDTAAINRALFQLYCRENNTEIRRSLYFPAGTYRITESIIIPSFAKLVGEGADCSIIWLDTSADISSLSAYVARYGDSLQQTGVNIGTNGATPPRNIEISSMTFRSAEITDVFLVEDANECWFDSVVFDGAVTESDIIDTGFNPATTNVAGVRFASTASLVCRDINFNRCTFTHLTYGVATSTATAGITITNGAFYILYQGLILDGDATGFRAVHNTFDDIYAEGIVYDDVSLNVSAYNIFYNVGNNIGSSDPVTACIRFGTDNNISVGDMFERSDAQNSEVPRIEISISASATGGSGMQLGRYARDNGKTFTMSNNQSAQPVFTVNTQDTKAFSLFYTITRATAVRHGSIQVVTGADDSSADIAYADDYTENTDTGVTLLATQVNDTITFRYSTSNTGNPATLTYSLSHLA
jgi:hypothetical protein